MGKINDTLFNREMCNNVIDEDDTRKVISSVMKVISNSVSKSLGPYGSTCIIRDPYNTRDHTITKDGYSILRKISFEGKLQSTILDMILKISKSLVDEVGDASTSSVIVAEKMYSSLNNFFNNNNVSRKDVLDFLDALENEIEPMIRSISTKLTTKEELSKVASISNNNDKKIGELVASIYEELDFQGFINLELSPTNNTYHEITNGIEILRGYTNFIYTNQKDKTTAIYENANVLLVNDELNENDMFFMGEILSLTVASSIPLIIIAKDYSQEILNVLNGNKVKFKDGLPIVPITYRLATLNNHEEFEDLAIYLNGTIYDKYHGEQLDKQDAGNFFMEKLGKCNKAIVTEKRTLLIEGNFVKEEIDDRLKLIEESMEEINKKANYSDVSTDIYNLEVRKNRIKGKIATLYVGGASSIEKKTRRDLVEDSVYSCKSAIENGYVIGGNLIIPHILQHNSDKLIEKMCNNEELFRGFNKDIKEKFITSLIDIVNEAFSSSFLRVLYNKFLNEEECNKILNTCISNKELKIYNLKTSKMESIEDTDVINSCCTDIEMMKSVFSIIGLLASSNQMLATDNIYEY